MPFGFGRGGRHHHGGGRHHMMHHHHRGPGVAGPLLVGAALGAGAMYATRRRPHPPPRYGRPGYYYNYPHVIYVHSPAPQREAHMYPTIVVQQPNGGNVITDSHLVEIPPDIYPGESFRVQVGGFEYLLTCPDSIPGGQGGRFILAVRGGHTNQIPKNAVQATIPAANRYQQPITYSSVPVTGVAGGGGGAAYGAPVPCAPVVPDNNSSHGFMSPEQQKQQQQQQPQYATASAMAATPSNGGNNSNNPFAGAVPGVSNYPPQQQQYQQYQQPVMATATVVGADGSYAPMATGVAVSAEAVAVNIKESEGAGGGYSGASASSGRGAAEKKCSLCTFDNKPTASTCEMCNTAL